MSRTATYTLVTAALLLVSVGVRAQAPQPAPQSSPAQAAPMPQDPGAAQAPAAPSQPAPEPAPGYAYDPAGRRDPFVTLAGQATDPRSLANRASGLTGVLINEVSLKGIMRDRSGFVALVQGPDNKTYIVKAGDKLMDGSVKSIVADAVVFSQDVNDPLSLVKQREIRKSLRSEESRG